MFTRFLDFQLSHLFFTALCSIFLSQQCIRWQINTMMKTEFSDYHQPIRNQHVILTNVNNELRCNLSSSPGANVKVDIQSDHGY